MKVTTTSFRKNLCSPRARAPMSSVHRWHRWWCSASRHAPHRCPSPHPQDAADGRIETGRHIMRLIEEHNEC
ncbi:hypothetical protein GN956_G24606 [Arapaima gigas]